MATEIKKVLIELEDPTVEMLKLLEKRDPEWKDKIDQFGKTLEQKRLEFRKKVVPVFSHYLEKLMQNF